MFHLHRPYCNRMMTKQTSKLPSQQLFNFNTNTEHINITTTLFFSSLATVMRRTLLLVTNISKIRIKIRIKRSNLRNIPIQLLNQTHVLHHIIRHSRLLILIHLLNYCPVPVKHRLNLPEALVQRLPCFGITVFSILHVRVVVVCWCGGGTAAALILLGTVVGVFHGGGR